MARSSDLGFSAEVEFETLQARIAELVHQAMQARGLTTQQVSNMSNFALDWTGMLVRGELRAVEGIQIGIAALAAMGLGLHVDAREGGGTDNNGGN